MAQSNYIEARMNNRNNTLPNTQDLLKFLSITTMIIDHLGLFIFFNSWMRVIGRFAAPIFLFFVGYNYFHKKNTGIKYSFELGSYRNILAFGVICHVMTLIHIPDFTTFNILIAISIGLLITDLIINYRISKFIAIPSLVALWPLTYSYFDYGTLSPALIYLGYIANSKRDHAFTILTFLVLLGHFSFSYVIMNFSNIELTITFIFTALSIFFFIKLDFAKIINVKLLSISRYALRIYVIHYLTLVLLSSILYFW